MLLVLIGDCQLKKREQWALTKTVQGNLDPAILLAPWEVIEERAKAILDQGMEQGGYIFNLGHGVFPDVNPATLKRLTRLFMIIQKKQRYMLNTKLCQINWQSNSIDRNFSL